MNKERKKLLLIVLAFFVLLFGGMLAYRYLSKQASPQNLAEIRPETETSAVTESNTDTDSSAETETDTDTDSSAVTEADTDTAVSEYLAPDFTFYDDAGNTYSLSDFFGKPLVLNFWSSTCPPCKSEMPEFQEVYDAVGEEVTFLMMDCVGIAIGTGVETKEAALQYIEEEGLTLPVYFDTTQSGVRTYGLSSFPTTFFIAANGDLVTYAMGAINKATLEKGISMITE